MVSVVVETHATSENNEKGIASGWRDPPLSDTCLEQASRLSSRRANDGIAAVFCSALQRATQTAHIAFQNVDIPIYIDPRLRECNYGALSGMPANEVTGRRGQLIDIPHPEGESWREAVQRVQSFISELPDSSPDGLPAGLRNRVCKFDFCRGQTTAIRASELFTGEGTVVRLIQVSGAASS